MNEDNKNGETTVDTMEPHKVQQEDIGDMLTAMSSTPEMVDRAAEAAKEGPVDGGGETDVSKIKEEKSEEKPTDKKEEAKEVEEKKEEVAEKTEEAKDEEDTKKKEGDEETTPEISDKLLKMLNDQAAGIQVNSADDNVNVDENKKEEEAKPIEKPPETQPIIANVDFINQELHEKMLLGPEGMNEVLSQMSGTIKQAALIEMLGALKVLVPQFTDMSITRERFLENNPDLKIVKNILANKVNELRTQDPKKPFNELLEAAAEEVRTATGLKKAKVVSTDGSKGKGDAKKTKFANSQSSANNNRAEVDSNKEKKSEFDTQVDDMLAAVM